MEILANHGNLFLLLAIIFSFFMAYGVGANDVANAMGTSVGSKAITIQQAIFIAVIFEFMGAVLAGGEVTSTIRKGILDTSAFIQNPEFLVYGMLASLLGAGIWLLIASSYGWPVSTTHSIVGAVIGFGSVGIGFDAVAWNKVGTIILSWVISPLTAGSLAFLFYKSLQYFIINTNQPLENAKKYTPVYTFIMGFVVALVTLFKGLKHIGWQLSSDTNYLLAAFFGLFVMGIGFVIQNLRFSKKRMSATKALNLSHAEEEKQMEKIFASLMLITACAMAFAHGSNDVANAIGPLAAIYSVINNLQITGNQSGLSSWILLIGGGGIVLGLVTYGHKVIATIGKEITHLTPSRGFAAELAAATTVVIASSTGIPVSTTHTLVGAVLGVGLAKGIKAINTKMINKIFLSWIITLPAGALMSLIFFSIFQFLFS
ncbi:MAG: inorganic phosphate transporter [Bdellovibrionaceae bacterium]|nr:inorganic phosphate transporter [Pseudobdellovibrionaceae bacterium]